MHVSLPRSAGPRHRFRCMIEEQCAQYDTRLRALDGSCRSQRALPGNAGYARHPDTEQHLRTPRLQLLMYDASVSMTDALRTSVICAPESCCLMVRTTCSGHVESVSGGCSRGWNNRSKGARNLLLADWSHYSPPTCHFPLFTAVASRGTVWAPAIA